MPKVSIIVPVYNVEKYLDKCLNSVKAQTFTDFEAICVNDGSTDGSLEILQKYASADTRFRIITEENSGLSCARNRGLQEAVGDYIYFLDSDDFIHNRLLETALSFAERFQADMVSFGYEKSTKTKEENQIFDIASLPYEITSEPLFYINGRKNFKIRYNVWSKIYRKKLLDGLEFIPGLSFQDYPYTFAVCARRPKTVLLQEPLYRYTYNPDAISHQKETPKRIRNYQTGTYFVLDLLPGLTPLEQKHIRRRFIPNSLKNQYQKCLSADGENREEMLRVLAEELRDLQKRGLLSWHGHNIFRYLKYLSILRNY